MQSTKNNLGKRFHSAFVLHDQIARFEAIRELFDLIDAREENIEDGTQELIAGTRQESEKSVISYIWARLATMKPNESLKVFAENELDNPVSYHRRFALQYLASVYPEDRKKLYEKMVNDIDPTVLFEVGEMILPLDSKAAVELWFSIISLSPHVLGDEIIPYYISKYADEEFISYLKQLQTENPDDKIVEMLLSYIDMMSHKQSK